MAEAEKVEFEPVTGDASEDRRDEGEMTVPGIEVTMLTVLLSVNVETLVNVTVEDECSSVQVVLMNPDWLLDDP